MQKSTAAAHFVPGTRLLAFDFAVVVSARRCPVLTYAVLLLGGVGGWTGQVFAMRPHEQCGTEIAYGAMRYAVLR
eukprot:874306-Rhodomonas_salina.2